jgi:hypothetical protein
MPTAAMMAQGNMVPPGASQAGVQPAGHLGGSEQVSPGTLQGMGLLHDSLLPSERERAAESLSRCDWKVEPQAAHALLTAAGTDPAPTVRVACVRALARMKANTAPVVQGVAALKADPDLRVRQEVEQALAVLKTP